MRTCSKCSALFSTTRTHHLAQCDACLRASKRQAGSVERARLRARDTATLQADALRLHPSGAKRCHRCSAHLSIEDFCTDRNRNDGLRTVCRRCDWHKWGDAGTRARLLKPGTPCTYCPALATTLDHVVPRSRGGSDDAANLAPACTSCNASKGARTLTEWPRHPFF